MYKKQTRYQDDNAAFSNIVRVGIVIDVDRIKRLVKVCFQDMGIYSDWIPVLTGGSFPEFNDQVLCLYEPIRDGRGFVLGGIQPWQ